MLNGPHTRVRVDAAVMPSAPPMVSPQAKGRKKAAPLRQMGLGNFYKGRLLHSRWRHSIVKKSGSACCDGQSTPAMIPAIRGLATRAPHSELRHVLPYTGAVVM